MVKSETLLPFDFCLLTFDLPFTPPFSCIQALQPYNEISKFFNAKDIRVMSTTTGAGLEGVVAGESEICYIDGYAGILSYRGYNIHTLADNATFEEVIFLLWNGWLPEKRTRSAQDRSGRASRDSRRR